VLHRGRCELSFDDFLSSFTTLFVVVDPVGLAPVFLALTFGMGEAERRKVALQASLIAFLILLAAAFGGAWVLSQLGITIPAFRIAGGLFLFVIAFEMVFGRRTDRKIANTGAVNAQAEQENIAAFPLAIPLMSGPGAITATIILSGNTGGDPVGLGLLVAILMLVGLSCAAVFLFASRFERFINRTGQIVFTRLLGLILAALAVQIVIDGIAGSGLFQA
jgi:multiple antibiotic resistance protein